MTLPNAEDPCWCGSNEPYGECHLEIDLASPDLRVPTARRVYLERWQVSARNFDLQKAYDWMASLLAPSQPNRILDIGCGSGEGLAAVHRRFPNSRILSCDENPDALSAAQERLKNIGAHVSVIPRITVVAISDRSHELKFQQGKLKMGHGITLIESDILIDDDLLSFLAVQKEFDAITIWLIGSHRLRYDECTNLASFNIQLLPAHLQ
jgi:SAM-dependent methyltransferase